MRDVLIVLIIGVGTYAMRAAFLVTARSAPPPALARLLPNVGPAVLAAITAPALLAPGGSYSFAETVPAAIAAVAAWAQWRRTHSIATALFLGLGVWWGALWIV